MADPPTEPEYETIELGDFTLIRWEDEWKLWCGCGDVIDLEDVIHGHCVNCHVTCKPEGQLLPSRVDDDG